MDSPTLTGEERLLDEAKTGADITTEHDAYLRIVLIKEGIGEDYSQASVVSFNLIGDNRIDQLEDSIDELSYTYDGSDWLYVYGTYNSSTGAQNGSPNAVRLNWVPYALVGSTISLTNSAITNGYNLRVQVMKTVSTTGASEIIENYNNVTSASIGVSGFLRIAILKSGIGNELLDNTVTQSDIRDLLDINIKCMKNYINHAWIGKKLNAIGDSIVKGDYGNFVIPLHSYLGLSVSRNYGIGGSCIASSAARDENYPPAVLRYTNMDDDADIIVVHARINDYSGDIPLGAADSTDITQFNGALNVMMVGLRTKYPAAVIIFSQILDRENDNGEVNSNNNTCQEFRDALAAACIRNHTILYDGFVNLPFDMKNPNSAFRNDGIHPNQTGATMLGRSLAGFIEWH